MSTDLTPNLDFCPKRALIFGYYERGDRIVDTGHLMTVRATKMCVSKLADYGIPDMIDVEDCESKIDHVNFHFLG